MRKARVHKGGGLREKAWGGPVARGGTEHGWEETGLRRWLGREGTLS